MSALALCLLVAGGAGGPGAASDAIVPNENLVLDGIPRIPSALAESVGRYTESRSARFQAWHPERREMLVTTRFADTTQVHLVKHPGGARRQMTFFPDRVTQASFPRHDPGYFVFAMDKGGDEFTQLYRDDLATGDVTLLTDGGRSQNSLGAWSRSGDRLAYGSTRRNGADRDIYLVDPRDPKSDRRLVELSGGGWQALDWSPDDRQLLVGERLSINESYLWLVDAMTGAKRPLTARSAPDKAAYAGGRFSADGKGVYVATDKDSEFMRLAYIDLATGRHTSLTAQASWDVEDFDLSPDGRRLAFVINEGGASVLRLIDIATGSVTPVSGLPLGVVGEVSWHANGKDLAITFCDGRSPYDVYSLDAQTGRLDRWTESETGGLNPARFPVPELVRWTSFDGREISGFLYRPPTRFSGRRPVMIKIHGGPESQARPEFLASSNYFTNELGVALLYPNVRGSSGYGKAFLKLDDGLLREDSVKDVGALLDWIATRPDLDADRVMVTGASYGGYMTLAVAARYADRIRCAMDVVGISNFVSFLERTEAYRRDLRRVEYGDERDAKTREFLLRISPLNSAERITKPLFVVEGANDPRVPAEESQQIVRTLKQNAASVWYLVGKDEGHGFAKKRNVDFLFYATVAFVQEFLLR